MSACCGKDTPSTAKLFQLIGDESVDEQAAVLNYQALCDSSIHPTVENLVAPLSGKAKYDKPAYEQNWREFQATCAQLDKNLEGKTFLLGDSITTADTTLGSDLQTFFFCEKFFDQKKFSRKISSFKLFNFVTTCLRNNYLNRFRKRR